VSGHLPASSQTICEAMTQRDIAGKEHWDSIYRTKDSAQVSWRPGSYDELVLEHALLGQIERLKPRTLLEVGCGNSLWLPYLARKTGAKVAGMDYSEAGCELARQRLRSQEVEGKVWCGDLFRANLEEVGQYDFVFSLGLVEHFSDLEGVLSALLRFVRPGGALFTEVPNLRSVHGLMTWAWQPELFGKHELVSKKHLRRAYEHLGLKDIRQQYLGTFSLDIVGWSIYPRWPRLATHVAPRISQFNERFVDYYLRRLGWFRGIAPLAPYLYTVGTKS
jgi:2-polyprenyl-3-methyl-5-hydroxy-6-metoxy-1,4-benzoquinol methylase